MCRAFNERGTLMRYYDSEGYEVTMWDVEERKPVEWSVLGKVNGEWIDHYIKATSEEAAEEKFHERYDDCTVEDVEATLSEWQE